ncbi:MAG: FtsW/RodA/SpoVE family cell cycle protein [Bacteroidales bacterium]|nr:FtsW/RodA/SpoVE family cell cycle protein [Bacteroidales bacterium]
MEDLGTQIKDKLTSMGVTSVKSLFIGNKVIWMIILALAAISLVSVFSSSSMLVIHGGEESYIRVLFKQVVLLLAGLCIIIFFAHYVYRLKPGLIKKHSLFWLIVSIILLLLTFTSAFSEEVNGANRWISIFGFSFQPSEFAKLTLVVYISAVFSDNRDNVGDVKKVLFRIIGATGIVALIVLVSNFSTAAFIVIIMFFMLFLGGIPFKQFFALIGVGILVAGIMGFIILKEPQLFPRGQTWQKRVVSFVPALAPIASGYDAAHEYAPIDNHQVMQSKIAIANGGIFGKGPGNSQQRYRLSQAYCDFIYAIIVEETGWPGAVIVVLLYIWLVWQAMKVVKTMNYTFDVLVVLGLTFMMTCQAFLHMGVVVNLLPATGQTLPVISSGGSSLFITCIEFGIILGMCEYAEKHPEKKEK